MKLSSDTSVILFVHEGIITITSLSDFDKKSIENFPSVCKNIIPAIEADAINSVADEASVDGANISSISASRLMSAVSAEKCCRFIARTTNSKNMSYANVLATLKFEHEACLSINIEDCSKVPKTNGRDND